MDPSEPPVSTLGLRGIHSANKKRRDDQQNTANKLSARLYTDSINRSEQHTDFNGSMAAQLMFTCLPACPPVYLSLPPYVSVPLKALVNSTLFPII